MSVLRFRAPWRRRLVTRPPAAGWPVAWIAHALSLGSLGCGFLSLLASASHDHVAAAGLVVAAVFLDGMDGAAARALHTESSFGEMMDSLADLAAFGLAPAFLMHQAQLHRLGTAGLLAALAFVACGTIRLARFPLARRPHHFVGLPIPIAGAFVALLGASAADLSWPMPFPLLTLLTLLVMLGVALLMVSTVEFPKFDTALGVFPTMVRWALMLLLVPVLFIVARWVLLCLVACYLAVGAAGAAGHAPGRDRA
jgi:CDP-diacylglycerol--serine O-phosphatidyltransferase